MAGEIAIFDGRVDNRDADIAELQEEVRNLRADLKQARAETDRARRESTRALSALRQQLSPLHRALQMVFGELDAAGVDEASEAPHTAQHVGGRDARQMALWNDWKAKLSPACGKVIDALLLHSDLSVKQIRAAAHMGENTVYQATSKLGQLGLVSKNGGRFSLKQL